MSWVSWVHADRIKHPDRARKHDRHIQPALHIENMVLRLSMYVKPQADMCVLTRTSHCISNIRQGVLQDCLGNLVSVNWMRGGAHPRAYDSSEISLELCAAHLDSNKP